LLSLGGLLATNGPEAAAGGPQFRDPALEPYGGSWGWVVPVWTGPNKVRLLLIDPYGDAYFIL
jgi:hypothetical protein